MAVYRAEDCRECGSKVIVTTTSGQARASGDSPVLTIETCTSSDCVTNQPTSRMVKPQP